MTAEVESTRTTTDYQSATPALVTMSPLPTSLALRSGTVIPTATGSPGDQPTSRTAATLVQLSCISRPSW